MDREILPLPQALSPASGSCPPPPTPATTQRCLSESFGSCAVWKNWALQGAASPCPHVPPRTPNCSPATGQTHTPSPCLGWDGASGHTCHRVGRGLELGVSVPGRWSRCGTREGPWRGPNPLTAPCPVCASSAEYVGRLRATAKMKTRELHREGSNFDSIYICPGTFACAQLATGATCRLVEAVLAGEVPPPQGGAPLWRGGGGGGWA